MPPIACARRLLRARLKRPDGCPAEQRDELPPFHSPTSPVLLTERIAHLGTEETAALRDFNAAYDRSGSFASNAIKVARDPCPLYLQKRTSIQPIGAEDTHRRLQRGLRRSRIKAKSPRSARIILDVDPFSDGKGVVEFDTQESHRTLDLGEA